MERKERERRGYIRTRGVLLYGAEKKLDEGKLFTNQVNNETLTN